MKKLSVLLAIAFLTVCVSEATADKIIKYSGEVLKGKIGTITQKAVALDGNKHSIASIKALEFEGEPGDLTQGRKLLTSERPNYKRAYALLARVRTTNRNMKADVEFYKALCHAKMGRARAMKAFLTTPAYSSSYHYYEANEIMAELAIAAAAKATDPGPVLQVAEGYAGRLATAAGLPAIKQKGILLRGNILLAQKNYVAAMQQFNMVESDAGQGLIAMHNKMSAKVGRAKCLAATEKPDAGVTLVYEVIAWAQVGDNDLHARAYNSLGFCHRVAKRPKDAVLAYLHTEVLYFQDSILRTEARKSLGELFTELGEKEKAKEFQR